MHQLIVVSSQREIQPFIEKAGLSKEIPCYKAIGIRDDLSLMVSGIGSPETIFHLTRQLESTSINRVIQVGIAGSYNPEYALGSLVEVGEDCFADLGIDDNGRFLSVFDTGLADPEKEPFRKGKLINWQQGLTGFPVVKGITVNTTSGSQERIEQWKKTYQPDIESMEGAAAIFVCQNFDVPVIQLRSISNMVEPRNRDSWDLDLAVENLNKWLLEFVNV